MEDWHDTEVRVRYSETDQMGIVHHANYLVWFESARSELCRAKGFSYKEMEEVDGSFIVVAESYCRYKAPAHYDDVLIVRTRVDEIRSRSIRFMYEVLRPSDESLIAEGETLHLVTDREQKVRRIPEIFRTLLTESSENSFPPDQPPS
jgi:acyl-CoA thioester hydrolase